MRQKLLIRISFIVALVALFAWAQVAYAQTRTVVGNVTDETGTPMVGLTVIVTGTATGATTDIDGNYQLSAPEHGSLTFSYLGYQTEVVEINGRTRIDIQLMPDVEFLSDAIVIGYGTTAKKDLTGSVASVGTKDFNNGLISSPEQLINGKVAGVQIMSSSGSPTAGSTIRIRGGASLNASNDPLIVLDGIPLEIGGISGNDGNFLAMINPSDIESMTVLKDASSTAIYGSRASNGVIIITTKKGSGNRMTVNVTSTQSIQWKTKLADMLSTDEFINVVNGLDESYTSLLGDARTDWNSQIYTPAFGTDNIVSVSGRIARNLPLRASVGYYNQDGILKTDNAQRATANISLNPSFFDDYLKLGFKLKGAYNHNRFAPTGAIWNAATFNPTLPVYSGQDFLGGYTEVTSNGTPNPEAVKNPLGLLEQTDAQSEVYRLVGNAELDYRMHFLPDLKLHLAYGYDYATGKGFTKVPETAASNYDQKGYYAPYGPAQKHNSLVTAYLNYNTEVKGFRIDVTAGYDWQYWKASSPAGDIYNAAGESLNGAYKATDQRHALMSYYGRVNLSYDSRYMITATVRRDGTSRFSPDTRWGTFPSVALAWNITEEPFLRDNGTVSNLKLRTSYGVTGQQDGIGNYNYLPVYWQGTENSQYVGSDGQMVNTWLPSAYVSDLKWETTRSWNAGFDFGFLNDRITGSVDYYTRNTEDLLATVPAAAGTNFSRVITTNVGNMESYGIEASLNVVPVQTGDWTWEVGANLTWQNVNITNLTLVDNGEVTETLVGPMIDGKYVQVMTEGQAPYSFFVYKQLYDTDGRPIEGAYADLNNDGSITIDDRYCYHSPAADFLLGFNTALSWRNLSVSAVFRASIGNYVYNAMAVNTGALETMKYSAPQLNNLHSSYLETGFKTRQFYSDHYVENASFLKMDNLTVSYDFGRVFRNAVGLKVSALVQNVFTLTKYSGVDPEVPNGFDSSFYPRPRIVSLSLGLDF
ncbi:MAG: SusC/RagA family TonB-linked outer membrane protein [Candidatus Cryptobacteroides sp.]